VNAINRSLQKLSYIYNGWDELVISMTDAKHLNEYKLTGTKSTLLDRKPTYLVDLSLIKSKGYLEHYQKIAATKYGDQYENMNRVRVNLD
jgi:hypothetical protein